MKKIKDLNTMDIIGSNDRDEQKEFLNYELKIRNYETNYNKYFCSNPICENFNQVCSEQYCDFCGDACQEKDI